VGEQVLAQWAEDVKQHHWFLEHRRTMLEPGWKKQDVTGRRDPLGARDGEPHATALDDGDLLVRMGVHGRHDARRERETADHEPFAPDHLALDALGELFGWIGGPVLVLERGNVDGIHGRADRPLSRPEPSVAKSGWTLTTPYWRSSSSTLAAIIHTKL